MTRRILITGERDWTDYGAVKNVLASFQFVPGGMIFTPLLYDIVFVHGDCPTGADLMVRDWCEAHAHQGARHEPHPADFKTLGPKAGPLRNQEMVSLGPYEACYAFWSGKTAKSGTFDTIVRATKAGIPVHIIPRNP